MIPLALCLALALQVPVPPPAPAPQKEAATATAPTPQALQAGVLPADTTHEARALWKSLLGALRPQGKSDQPPAAIEAFDLTLKVRHTLVAEGGGTQKNDLAMRYRYLAPGYVRTTLIETGVERMRGPQGDFLWDPKKGDVVSLADREFENDRLELTRELSMARNYVRLADPARLRIASLRTLAGPPPTLRSPPVEPGESAKPGPFAHAPKLLWIEVQSPDFDVVQAMPSKLPLMFRAQMGLDAVSFLPQIVVIWQDEKGAMVPETAVLVDLTPPTKYEGLDGMLVPTFFRVHDPLLPSSPFSFQPAPRVEVEVKKRSSTLKPKLSGEDFRPPKQG